MFLDLNHKNRSFLIVIGKIIMSFLLLILVHAQLFNFLGNIKKTEHAKGQTLFS